MGLALWFLFLGSICLGLMLSSILLHEDLIAGSFAGAAFWCFGLAIGNYGKALAGKS